VELADDAGFAAYHLPNERARVSFGREGFDGPVASVVDGELLGLDTKVISSVGHQSGVAPDSEVGGVAILSDGKTMPALRVELGRDGESKLRSAGSDPKLPVVGILERGLWVGRRSGGPASLCTTVSLHSTTTPSTP